MFRVAYAKTATGAVMSPSLNVRATIQKWVQPFIWTFFLASLAIGALTWRFLFPQPLYFCAALTACLGLALFPVAK